MSEREHGKKDVVSGKEHQNVRKGSRQWEKVAERASKWQDMRLMVYTGLLKYIHTRTHTPTHPQANSNYTQHGALIQEA